MAPEFDSRRSSEFERIFLPYLDVAYKLAHFLMRNAEDAEDVVQESYLKALRGFRHLRGDASRAWLLAIVRNTCFSLLVRNQRHRSATKSPDEEIPTPGISPEEELLARERSGVLRQCMDELPDVFREVLVLREMQDLSYDEIAKITGTPAGTVMSRLARARSRLASCLCRKKEAR